MAGTTTGATFLELGDGSRPLALAGAYTAVGGDVDALYYNPAGTAFLARPEVSFSHSDWLESTNFDVISYGHPTSLGTIGLSALRMGDGTFDGRDANRQATGNFSADDVAVLLSYSHTLCADAGAGLNVKYLRSRIANDSASSVALDLGTQARWPGLPLSFGGSVMNVGTGLRFVDQVDRLPLTVNVGVALRPISSILLTGDFVHQPYDQISRLRFGVEYGISLFAFRLGYDQLLQGTGNSSLNTSESLRGGLGFHWGRYKFDYTLAPFGDLGLTQRFTISLMFGPVEHLDETPKTLKPPAGAGALSR